MNVWSVPSKFLPTKSLWLRNLIHGDLSNVTRAAAYVGLGLYALLTFASYYSTLQPPSLGIDFGSCDGNACVEWVMPAGIAWDAGARPGMPLNSINGETVTSASLSSASAADATEFVVTDSSGTLISISSPQTAFSQDSTKFSLWGLSAVFALLGAGVVLRRPDFKSARRFGVFSIVPAVALTIGPSSSGASQSWALAIQFASIVVVGASCVSFCASLVGFDSSRFHKPIFSTILFVAAAVLLAYTVAVVQAPPIYEIVRPIAFLGFALSMLFGIVLLAVAGFRSSDSTLKQQARIALAGVATSSLPFVGLTLIPLVIGQDSLVPIHLSVLAIGIMPVFFAYSLLHHQLFGILVDRVWISDFVQRGCVVERSHSYLKFVRIAERTTATTVAKVISGDGDSIIAVEIERRRVLQTSECRVDGILPTLDRHVGRPICSLRDREPRCRRQMKRAFRNAQLHGNLQAA